MKETYSIPTAAREDVMKSINKLQRKALAYGKTLICEEGAVYAKKRAIISFDYDHTTGSTVQRHIGDEMIEVFDLTIDSDIVMKDGYKVAARIEHLEGGNVISMFEDGDIPDEWHHIPPHCDHCEHKRDRRITFIVRKDDETYKQIGRTCLKDYCGIDPQSVGILNQLRALILNEYELDACDFEKHNYGNCKAYDVQNALAFSIRVLANQGYIKSDERRSNSSIVKELMSDNDKPTESEIKSAKELMKDIMEVPEEEAHGAMLSNVQSIIKNSYCRHNHFGYLAYAPVAYERYMAYRERKRAKEEQKAIECSASEWLGEIGKRIVVEIESCTLLTSWQNDYGYTYLYKMCAKNGSVLIWYASKPFNVIEKKLDNLGRDISEYKGFKNGAIKATIKDHTERDGIKQTVITRCAIVA